MAGTRAEQGEHLFTGYQQADSECVVDACLCVYIRVFPAVEFLAPPKMFWSGQKTKQQRLNIWT